MKQTESYSVYGVSPMNKGISRVPLLDVLCLYVKRMSVQYKNKQK